jgi:hypothetical protein
VEEFVKLILVILLTVSANAFAADTSFVDCDGRLAFSKNGDEKKYDGHIRIQPLQKENGLRGQVDWKALVDTPDGKLEVKPLAVSYSLAMQTITIDYEGAEGRLTLAVSTEDRSRIGGHQRGDFGLSLKQDSTEVNGLGLECVLTKHFID